MRLTACTLPSDVACWNRSTIPVVYEAVRIDTGFYADLMVENQVIVEIKAVETVAPVRLADKRLGLLINFNLL
jgi:GxxExxY protein